MARMIAITAARERQVFQKTLPLAACPLGEKSLLAQLLLSFGFGSSTFVSLGVSAIFCSLLLFSGSVAAAVSLEVSVLLFTASVAGPVFISLPVTFAGSGVFVVVSGLWAPTIEQRAHRIKEDMCIKVFMI